MVVMMMMAELARILRRGDKEEEDEVRSAEAAPAS